MVLFVDIAVLCISSAISQSLTTIEFDDYGNKYLRARLSSNAARTYQIALAHQEYLYITGSSTVNYELIHANTNITFESEEDSRSRPYFLLNPENTEIVCSPYNYENCNFNLIVTNTLSSSSSIWIRFNRNLVVEPKTMYPNTIELRKRRRYAMKITSSQLPILVRLTPNENHHGMDIDLYGYSEKAFTSYYYPNRAERNHINNYVEQYLITSSDAYFADGEWHFFEIYGSTDSIYDDMDYEFEVITNYQYRFVVHYDHNNLRIDEPDTLLKKILLVFAFTIAISFILGITVSFLCSFRHQILFCLRIRSTPHRNGASKRQIKQLRVAHYKENMVEELDSTQCIICLDDYEENDKIRILKCNHNFHVHCSDEWFYINRKCPLCNQNIVEAKDVHENKDTEVEMTEICARANDELQELHSDVSSLNQSIPVDVDPPNTVNC